MPLRGLSRRVDDAPVAASDENDRPATGFAAARDRIVEPETTDGEDAHDASPLLSTPARSRPDFPLGLVLTALATLTLTLGGLLIAWHLHPSNSPIAGTRSNALPLFVGGLVIVQITLIGIIAYREWYGRRMRSSEATRAEDIRESLERARTILEAEPQIAITWMGGRRPDVFGNAELMEQLGGLHRIAAFGTWAAPSGAARLEHAVTRLRETGESFRLSVPLKGRSGHALLATGEVRDAAALLRLRDETEEAESRAVAEAARETAEAQAKALRTLLEAVPVPVWQRDPKGQVSWTNAAYSAAVSRPAIAGAKAPHRQAKDAEPGVEELLSESARRAMAISRLEGDIFRARTNAVMAGERRTLDVCEVPVEDGAVGIAFDATEAEDAKAELQRHIESHARTLDQLHTAVAIFGPDKRLLFHNEAYRELLGLDHAWLLTAPLDAEILERLREIGRVPEQTDFRAWKRQTLEIYRALEPREDWWPMPDGQMLRVVATPGAEGGVIYFYEDHTEKLDLESRLDTLGRVQGETLDNLREGVAVFASNGRLSLCNPSFAEMWGLGAGVAMDEPHIDEIIGAASGFDTAPDWKRIKAMVTEIDTRESTGGRMTRSDGKTLDYLVQPLPDGATLVTFGDMTDSLSAATALQERNQALVAADELKNAFVSHVSYELRTPLTHIIGFSEVLASEQFGVLNDKQREYADDIYTSSDALMTIIDHILDLATIDAGAMELEIDDLDVREAVEIAAEGLADRIRENEIRLDLSIAPDVGTVAADSNRLTQILFNLLSNAVGVSDPGGHVAVDVSREDNAIRFAISDDGPGLDQADLKRVFDRFETGPKRGRHRGAGLGLSIVQSFVDLHGGRIDATSTPGVGTTVSVTLPASRQSVEAVESQSDGSVPTSAADAMAIDTASELADLADDRASA